jgi:transposase InsO family protein
MQRIGSQFWWPHFEKNIRFRIESCRVCSERKTANTRPKWGLLKSIEVSEMFHTVAADHVGPLPKTKAGNRYILVFMEYYTRFAVLVASPSADAESVAVAFVDKIIPRFGAVRRFLTDRGQAFNSNLVKAIAAVFGTRKIFTTSYHPQCDGLVERFNGTMMEMLSKYASQLAQDDWDLFLSVIEFAYNASKQASLGESPFFLYTGRDPLFPDDFGELPAELLKSATVSLDLVLFRSKLLHRLDLARKLAQDSLRERQQSSAAYLCGIGLLSRMVFRWFFATTFSCLADCRS